MRFATAVTAALAAALSVAPAAHATFPGVNGLISFASDRSGDYEIYTMNPDGSDLKRLTNAPGTDGPGRWSPDGTKMVFASNRDGNSEIYTMNADGTGPTRLTNDPAIDNLPSWSPDGTKIAFTRLSPNSGEGEVFVMNADGTGQTQITTSPAGPGAGVPGGSNLDAYWGPDGRIAVASFSSADTSPFEIYAMNADGSGRTRITNDPVGALLPSWSLDATRLLFMSERDSNGEVYAVNADGTGETRLTNAPGSDSSPVYSPDGTTIVFSSQRDDGTHSQLYTMNPDGSAQTRLLTTTSNDLAPEWQSATLSPPVIGETVNVSVVSGTVRIKTRGKAGFQLLSQAAQIKVGSQLDTTKGVVRLASAAGKGKTQSGDFGRGVFQVAQSKSAKAKGLTDLTLKGGSFGSCKGSAKKGSAAAKKKTIRSLFSKAKGKFRTKGRYSAASVRGTTWIVTDRCDGTLTQVKSGTVSVFDFKRHKTVKVKAGKSYLARAR